MSICTCIRGLLLAALMFGGVMLSGAASGGKGGKKPVAPKRTAAVGAPNNWLTDFKAAEVQSAYSGMPIIILFTSSNGDPVSVKLRNTVIDKGLFKKLIAPRAVKVYIDFPQNSKLSPAEQKENNRLKAKYKVAKLPTTIVIGGRNSISRKRVKGKPVSLMGKEVLRIVGAPANYVRSLQRVITD